MAGKDLYKILGVPRTSSPEEIKRAYRKLAKEHHPDRNRNDPSAEKRFKEVQHAYSILKDKEKRAQYDQFGEVGAGDFRTGPSGQKVYTWGTEPGGRGSQINVEDLESLFDMFGQAQGAGPFDRFFKQRRPRQKPRPRGPIPARGQDIRRRISLAFEQAILGVTIEVDAKTGSAAQRETIEVKIPPGVEDGQQIRLKGKGQPGVGGGPPGDLFLICSVRPHKRFRRDGRDIYIDIPLTIPQAALGTKIDVPTLNDEVTLTIPPGTSGGAKFRLAGKGVPGHPRRPAGDQYIVARIQTPQKLTPRQKQIMEEFAKALEEDAKPKAKKS